MIKILPTPNNPLSCSFCPCDNQEHSRSEWNGDDHTSCECPVQINPGHNNDETKWDDEDADPNNTPVLVTNQHVLIFSVCTMCLTYIFHLSKSVCKYLNRNLTQN